MIKKNSNSSEETRKLGIEFASKIERGDIVLLFGDLGAGKTTFTQGLAKGLGIKDRIMSPTFILQRIHEVPARDNLQLNHIDLYRIDEKTDLKNLGIQDILEDKNAITIIEWAEKLEDYHPKKGYKIYFEHLEIDKRKIEIIEI